MAELGYSDSIGGIVRGILTDVRQLIREEIALARVEVREQAGRAKLAAAALGGAAVALLFGGIFLLVALAGAVADLLELPLWGGFLAVALLLGLIGLVLFLTGRSKLRALHALPEQTVATLKENSEWIAKRLSSASR